MLNKKNKTLAFIRQGLFILFLIFSFSVNAFAGDDFFKGVNFLENDNEAKAKSCFAKAIKSSNPVESYLALKSIYDLCSPSEKLSFSKKVYDSSDVSKNDVAIMYALALVENNQFSKAEKITAELLQQTDLTLVQKTCFLYCKAVSVLENGKVKTGKYDFQDSDVQYFVTKIAYSDYHNKFLLRYEDEDFADKKLLQFRQLANKKSYRKALEMCSDGNELLSFVAHSSGNQLSDIGKTLLFAPSSSKIGQDSLDYEKFALEFEKMAQTSLSAQVSGSANPTRPFYLYFYSARFYDKIGKTEKAVQNFLLAAKNSFSSSTYDNALWYYFSTLNSISESRFLSELEKYGSTIKSKSYYSDLFEQLFVSMLSSRRWTTFCNLNPYVSKYADEKTQGMYNYIFARLLQDEFVDKAKFPGEKLFRSVANNSSVSNYYLLISCERLGMSAEEALKTLFVNDEFVSPNPKITKDLMEFMDSAIKHKQVSTAYSIYRNFRPYLSSDYLVTVAKRVSDLAKKDENFYPIAPRFASAAIFAKGGGKTIELFKLYAPQFFCSEVQSMCKKYELKEDLMYGLIHSESFFDKDIISFAGAIGLCQLMLLTASEIAKKLRISTFDLRDAQTNIEFGCFYFAEMIRRHDGSIMSAIISYNSGITRVRNWHKAYPNVPIDIFVEMLPIAESRGYGKKVLSAAAIYGYLYYGKNTKDIIEELLR